LKYLADLSDAGFDDLDRREERAEKAFRMVNGDISLGDLSEKLEGMDKIFEEKRTWQRLSEGCSNCGLCTSVCPTCHCCFVVDEITDIVIDEVGQEVVQEWDPCMFNIFMSAGLSGPPPQGYQRLRRRIMDKFCHSARTLNQPFCVGCGRCILYCKEGVNLKEILKILMKSKLD
jgi:ferredoxin